ncbi:cytochrome P450 [Xylaria cf. heliscus]|nr:cytochrome P450 [Xylaria cf. heliscus]
MPVATLALNITMGLRQSIAEESLTLVVSAAHRPLQFLIGTIFLLAVSLVLYRLYIHPLRKVPGPFFARVTELWRTTHYFRGTWFDDIIELHRKYGPVVRISPSEVSVTNWYDTWHVLGGPENETRGVFDVTDPKDHGFMRKRVSAVYSLSSIMTMESKVQGVMNSLLERFDELEKKREPINLSAWASYFTYDVVGTLCLGKPMGFINAGGDNTNFIEANHGAFYWVSNVGFLPFQSYIFFNPITRFFDRFFRFRLMEHFGTFLSLVGDEVTERRKAPRMKKLDMLDHFLEIKDRQGNPAELIEVYGEIGNLLVAGADTTSVAIKAVLGPLLRDPLRYRRLQSELDEAYKTLGIAADQSISYSILKDLPFLDACVKEGSRLHPSIVYQLPRKAPSGGVELEGFFIDPSSTISMSALAQNRCQAIFGNDADEWKPERWIVGETNTEEQIRFMDKHLATFGYGSRTCIGRNLANVETTKFVAAILTRFDVELLNAAKPWSIHSQWFAEISNMRIRLHRRGERAVKE